MEARFITTTSADHGIHHEASPPGDCRYHGPRHAGRPVSAGVTDCLLFSFNYHDHRLILGATPSSDVAGAVMGQHLAGGRKDS